MVEVDGEIRESTPERQAESISLSWVRVLALGSALKVPALSSPRANRKRPEH